METGTVAEFGMEARPRQYSHTQSALKQCVCVCVSAGMCERVHVLTNIFVCAFVRTQDLEGA